MIGEDFERFLVVESFAPSPALIEVGAISESGICGIADVEEGCGDFAFFEADGEEEVTDGLDVGGVARHFEVAGDFWIRLVGNVDDPEGVDLLEGDSVKGVFVETSRK